MYNIHLCRICQIPGSLDLMDTSTITFNGETFLNILKYIFKDIAWKDDHLISVCCKNCLGKVIEISEFKRMCNEFNLKRCKTLKLNNKFKLVSKVEPTNKDKKSDVSEVEPTNIDKQAEVSEDESTNVDKKPEPEMPYAFRRKRRWAQTNGVVVKVSEKQKPKVKSKKNGDREKSMTRKKKIPQSVDSDEDVSNDAVGSVEGNEQEDKNNEEKTATEKPKTRKRKIPQNVDSDEDVSNDDAVGSFEGKGQEDKNYEEKTATKKPKTRKRKIPQSVEKRKIPKSVDSDEDVSDDDGVGSLEGNEQEDKNNEEKALTEKTCRICKRKLPNFESLKKHTEKVHPKHTFYNCGICEEAFAGNEYWERHEFKHTGTKKYICSFCGAKYITKSDLTHHMHNHEDESKFACKICPDKKFKTSNSLMKHKMLVHKDHKEYKHECSRCGMRFGMLSGLRTHLLRHAKIRDFSCYICDKRFCTKRELKNHSVTHSNVKPFRCDLCSREYKLNAARKRHKFLVHGIGNYKPAAKEQTFICQYCSKRIPSRHRLERHIRAHKGTRPFKCRLCKTTFICKSYVKGHVKVKHQDVDVDAPDFNVKSYYDVIEEEAESGKLEVEKKSEIILITVKASD